jgi:hypothetical protein
MTVVGVWAKQLSSWQISKSMASITSEACPVLGGIKTMRAAPKWVVQARVSRASHTKPSMFVLIALAPSLVFPFLILSL